MAETLTTLAALAGARLKARGLKLVTAESCTGGWVAEAVTAIPGSSDWFERGFVTYSNDAKRRCSARAATLTGRRGQRGDRARDGAAALAASRRGGGVDHRRRRPDRRHRDEAGGDGVLRLGARRRRSRAVTKHSGRPREVRRQSVASRCRDCSNGLRMSGE
jgi:nicotinamide-nucleotide amidase